MPVNTVVHNNLMLVPPAGEIETIAVRQVTRLHLFASAAPRLQFDLFLVPARLVEGEPTRRTEIDDRLLIYTKAFTFAAGTRVALAIAAVVRRPDRENTAALLSYLSAAPRPLNCAPPVWDLVLATFESVHLV